MTRSGTAPPGRSEQWGVWGAMSGPPTRSEHSVGVGGLLRDGLHDVPVLDDLAVLEPEDVDDGTAARAGLADGVDVQDHVVAVGEHPRYFDAASKSFWLIALS